MWESCETDECGQVFAASMRASGMRVRGNVLEIGSAEFNWLRMARRELSEVTLTGIDWRGSDPFPGDTVIKGDVLTHDFPKGSFDTVVALSTIEHIGLGHYKNDPKDEHGDTKTMNRVWSWLKPGGWLYFDVPWNPGEAYQVVGTKFRCYDDAQHEARLKQMPWTESWRGIFARERPRVQLVSNPTTPLNPLHKQFYFLACVWQKA